MRRRYYTPYFSPSLRSKKIPGWDSLVRMAARQAEGQLWDRLDDRLEYRLDERLMTGLKNNWTM
jgi:hypothetical protein